MISAGFVPPIFLVFQQRMVDDMRLIKHFIVMCDHCWNALARGKTPQDAMDSHNYVNESYKVMKK